MKYDNYVKVDPSKIAEAVAKSGMPKVEIDLLIGKSRGYMNTVLRRKQNIMDRETFEKLKTVLKGENVKETEVVKKGENVKETEVVKAHTSREADSQYLEIDPQVIKDLAAGFGISVSSLSKLIGRQPNHLAAVFCRTSSKLHRSDLSKLAAILGVEEAMLLKKEEPKPVAEAPKEEPVDTKANTNESASLADLRQEIQLLNTELRRMNSSQEELNKRQIDMMSKMMSMFVKWQEILDHMNNKLTGIETYNARMLYVWQGDNKKKESA